jgi:hypothetical protein
MDSAAQLMTERLSSRPIPDLQNTPLEELALQARDGHDFILDIVAQMIDDGDGQSSVPATMFNSAIG